MLKLGISISMLSKIADLLKDRRSPIWAPHQARKLSSERITTAEKSFGKNLLFSLTVDIENDFGIPENPSFTTLERGVSNLMTFFNKQNIDATFFVMKTVCDKIPNQVKKMGSHHEVGVHGYAHECWGKQKWWLRQRPLKIEQKRRYLAESVDVVEKTVSRTPKSFRAPYLVIDMESLGLLDELGFLVDSSAPSYYGISPKPYYPSGLSLLEVPVSADPRPWPELVPIPHFRFDYLNMKLLAMRGADWCANFVRDIVSYQTERGIKPHVVMLAHQWEFFGVKNVPGKSFEYAKGKNIDLLEEFITKIREMFKTRFVAMQELAKQVAPA
jgi:peptidoglycan/xylan/chitin deacetylase (PgdA/CDA1 family)